MPSNQFLPNSHVVVEMVAERAVQGNKRFDERESQVVAGHGLKNTLIIEALQVKSARRIPANVNPGKHRKPRADALNVGGLAAHNVSAFALLNESVTEIRPQGESIVPKEN